MDFYQYIASSSPRGSRQVIRNFGYQISDTSESALAPNLKLLVKNEGKPALEALAKIHPDKELILELFGNSGKKNCDCSGRIEKLENFMHFDGRPSGSQAKQVDNQTGIIFLGAALLIAAAIIVKR